MEINKCFILFSDERVRSHCNKTVDIYEDVSSPELTRQNRYRSMNCYYKFRVTKPALKDEWVIVVRFKSFKVGRVINATHCENGYIQVNIYFIFSFILCTGKFYFYKYLSSVICIYCIWFFFFQINPNSNIFFFKIDTDGYFIYLWIRVINFW